MTARQGFDELARALIGQTIGDVWRGYGSAVFAEIGRLTPRSGRDGSPRSPQGQISLGIGVSWRIQDERMILYGSWSEEVLWEPGFALLRGAAIGACHLFGALPEIDIATTGGLRFLSFATTEGQPGWHLVDRRDGPARWYSVRGGQLHLGDGSEPAFG
jgi:hypothetical protein